MSMKSISPIIATILIIVITVAIAGIFYAFTTGIFNPLIQSSSQQVQQQSQVTSFTISNVYCSNNIVYFDIYNNGNVPININNSQIIFTDNNGNTISINGSNIICNNGNIIPSGSNSLCYIINDSCYYNVTNYMESMNFVFNGISYNYDISGNNKFNLIFSTNFSISNSQSSSNTSTSSSSSSTSSSSSSSTSSSSTNSTSTSSSSASNSSTSSSSTSTSSTNINSGYIPITIYNTQNISTPSPFQQDIAICNGSINIGSSFAYVNNTTLFNEINSNGSNVYFVNSSGNILYSWYEGQLNYNGVACDVWWINISQGIPANSNITIYMNVGSNNANYYQQYYPYVGASPQVISGYDNGNYTFIAYGYFYNTFDGWKGYIFTGSFSPTVTGYGIEMLNSGSSEGTYILPPNNGNIPKIPLIVEEAWYYSGIGHANVIALFGNTSNQIYAASIGNTAGVDTPTSNLSTFAQFQYDYGTKPPNSQADMLKSAVTDQYLNYTSFPAYGGTFYSYLIVNSSYAQTGYYYYNSNQVWASLTLLDTNTYYNSNQIWVPLTLLDTYSVNNNGYTYANLNYNPFQYGTLEIGAGDGVYDTSTQYIEWVVARAYPPNGVMPSIYIS